jgi:hypothetical protein
MKVTRRPLKPGETFFGGGKGVLASAGARQGIAATGTLPRPPTKSGRRRASGNQVSDIKTAPSPPDGSDPRPTCA